MFPVPHPKYATAPRTAADSKYATFLQDGALGGSKFTILQNTAIVVFKPHELYNSYEVKFNL